MSVNMFENPALPQEFLPQESLADFTLRAGADLGGIAGQALAIEHLLIPVARLWCRSFGIADGLAVPQLTKMLMSAVEEELMAGARFEQIQSRFDEMAERIIRNWFCFVLGREIPLAGKSLAIVRLAFLDCNYNGKWSSVFLSKELCVQELAAELETMMIEPTPIVTPRTIVRQVF
jgi:hypothetical protein